MRKWPSNAPIPPVSIILLLTMAIGVARYAFGITAHPVPASEATMRVKRDVIAHKMFDYGIKRGRRDAKRKESLLPMLESYLPEAVGAIALGNAADYPSPQDVKLIGDALSNETPGWKRILLKSFVAGYAVGNMDGRGDATVDIYLDNLKRVGFALRRYIRTHDGRLPKAATGTEISSRLLDYLDDPSLFVNPITGEPYVWNSRLSGRLNSEFATPSHIVVMSEAHPASDGKRGVLFLDGTVARISESKWQSMIDQL